MWNSVAPSRTRVPMLLNSSTEVKIKRVPVLMRLLVARVVGCFWWLVVMVVGCRGGWLQACNYMKKKVCKIER